MSDLIYYNGEFPGATPSDVEETTEILTTETLVATPTDTYEDNSYSFNNLYLLGFGVALVCVGILFKKFFRRMYVNLLGGRKGE